MNDATTDILGLTSGEWVAMRQAAGEGTGGALATYRRVFREGVLEEVPSSGSCQPSAISRQPRAVGAIRELREGETLKFVLPIEDGLETESVILPMHGRGRTSYTLCVSSQVGCAMGCRFCETGRMGLLRNLTPAQVVRQWHVARHGYGAPIRNIVFMGMGEPMDNLDAVLQAIRVLTDRNGPCIAPASIAVSTVGRVEGIERLRRFAAQPGFRRLKLAVSLNAPNDAIRSSIMPINRAEPMEMLKKAMQAWTGVGREDRRRDAGATQAGVDDAAGTPVLIEYVLIPSVNDQPEHAEELAAYLRDLPCKVNVIPYNPRRDSPWPAPEESVVASFVERLRSLGLFVKRRRTLGRSVMAACGQLGNPGIRRRRFVSIGSENDADQSNPASA